MNIIKSRTQFYQSLSNVSLPIFKQTGSIQIGRHFIDLYFTFIKFVFLILSCTNKNLLVLLCVFWNEQFIYGIIWCIAGIRQEQCYNSNWTLITGQGNNSIILFVLSLAWWQFKLCTVSTHILIIKAWILVSMSSWIKTLASSQGNSNHCTILLFPTAWHTFNMYFAN